ncbi:hypothetical protein [Thiothrix fructosivorans]|uniref:Uncharacterized protein n=1 Tax=Thiothrix fructosivorans TaxID=111770 RepID=A0A8B0SP99_9GAMM|nr:hypothetical protein [Thiothrix fructosivorans]MBO0611604.1 hypothetical protein [Thiothrix fructosivorans]QTX10732.1 hypothetical protein J1836_019570 [Thiothrix fructosivorans]
MVKPTIYKQYLIIIFLAALWISSPVLADDGYYYSYPITAKPSSPDWWQRVNGGKLKPPPITDIDGLIEPELFEKHWQALCSISNQNTPDFNTIPKGYAGQLILVDDHYHEAGYKCYRNKGKDGYKVILQKENNGFRFIAPIEYITDTAKIFHTEEYHLALYDFLASDVRTDVTLYKGAYDSRMGFYDFIIKTGNKLSGIEFDELDWKYVFFDLTPDEIERWYVRHNTRDTYQSSDSHSHSKGSTISDGTQYIFRETGGLTILSDKGKLKNLPVLVTYPHWKKVRFIPASDDNQKNLSDLTVLIGQNLTRMKGEESAWASHWITGEGMLTLDNGQQVKTTNAQRLQTWLERYLRKQDVSLKKVQEYFFTQDIWVYLSMDHQ